MNETVNSFLTEDDYLKIFEIIRGLTRCKSMCDLNRVIEVQLFPLIRVDMGGVVWSNRDFLSGGNPVQGIICTLGVEDQERDQACLLEVGPYHKQFAGIVTTTRRNVIASDVDYPRETFKMEIHEFLKDHPRFEGTLYAQANSSIALLDRPDFEIGMGLCRIHPNEEPFTLREVRIMELLNPCLLGTAKTIALNAELKTYQSLIETLSQAQGALALTRNDGRVLFRNSAFHTIVPVEPGGLLPQPLREAIGQQKVVLNPDQQLESVIPPMMFYQHGETVYRFNLTQLQPKEGGSEPAWLLRLHPADDPFSALHRKLQETGLTPREVEVALLAGDGLDDVEVAQRLFISPNTFKNHLKSIYRKLGVHSRTQFMAWLHPQ